MKNDDIEKELEIIKNRCGLIMIALAWLIILPVLT